MGSQDARASDTLSTMKTLLLLTLLAAPLAHAQTDAMPPETHAPMPMPAKPVKPSNSLAVTFQGHTTTFTVSDLLKLPQTTITALDGHTHKTETFTGPLVADVLRQSGLVPSAETHALILHSSVIATGADGYFVLYSAAELEPMFANAKPIVALMKNGLPDTDGGTLQLINPADAKPARWVHGLTQLNVLSTAPVK